MQEPEHFRVDAGECVPPVCEGGKFVTDSSYTLFDGSLVFGNLVEAVQRVVVELATGIAVVVQRLTLAFGRVEAIPVVVVQGLRVAFFDEFIQVLLDERGEIQVVFLNPLFLVFTDGDCLPFHCMHIIRLAHNILSDCVGL
jgi:hypothetical protein